VLVAVVVEHLATVAKVELAVVVLVELVVTMDPQELLILVVVVAVVLMQVLVKAQLAVQVLLLSRFQTPIQQHSLLV
jgi:hypothetical protein